MELNAFFFCELVAFYEGFLKLSQTWIYLCSLQGLEENTENVKGQLSQTLATGSQRGALIFFFFFRALMHQFSHGGLCGH